MISTPFYYTLLPSAVMDGNAWDLVEEEPKESHPGSRARSPSLPPSRVGSRLGSHAEVVYEFEGDAINAEDISNILDEEMRRESEKRSQRGKSPAVESLRKMSRTILEKVGIKKKKDDVRLLFRTKDIADYTLDGICQRPTQYFYASPEESRFLPKILSAAVLTRSHRHKRDDHKEKCSYLFQSVESNPYEDATFPLRQWNVFMCTTPIARCMVPADGCPAGG
ncbi:CRE-UNC-93 protein [Aphelenchoides avenae]|nr:CRE-UNC-93 protein [Aphelenchus avenae]